MYLAFIIYLYMWLYSWQMPLDIKTQSLNLIVLFFFFQNFKYWKAKINLNEYECLQNIILKLVLIYNLIIILLYFYVVRLKGSKSWFICASLNSPRIFRPNFDNDIIQGFFEIENLIRSSCCSVRNDHFVCLGIENFMYCVYDRNERVEELLRDTNELLITIGSILLLKELCDAWHTCSCSYHNNESWHVLLDLS